MDTTIDSMIEAARGALPAWTAWTPLLVFAPLAWLGVFLGIRLAGGIMSRSKPKADDHWTERARVSYAVRVPVNALTGAGVALMTVVAARPLGTLSVLPRYALAAAVCAAAILGAWQGRRPFPGRARLTPPTLRNRLREQLSVLLLLYAPVTIALSALAMMPRALDAHALMLLAGVAASILFLVGGGGVRILCWLGLLEPASPRLSGLVARLCPSAGVRPRGIWEGQLGMANAFAMVTTREMVVSREAVAHLSDDELSAVCAHELGHLAEPPEVIIARVGPAVLTLLALAALPAVVGSYGLPALLALVLVILGSAIFARRLAQRLEVRADAAAHTLEADPGTYARALERIYALNEMPAVLGRRRGAHPDLYDRLIAAGVTPSYPRPAAPASRRMLFASLAGLLVIVGVQVSPLIAGHWLSKRYEDLEPLQLAVATLAGGRPRNLEGLSDYYAARDDVMRATVFQRLAVATSTGHGRVEQAYHLADLLTEDARCDEAEEVLEAAVSAHDCETAIEMRDVARTWIGECRQAHRTAPLGVQPASVP